MNRLTGLILGLALAPALAGADGNGVSVCGLTVFPSPMEPTFVSDACQDGTLLHQRVYVRGDSELQTSTTIQVPGEGELCIRVANGDGGVAGSGVSSARVRFDGRFIAHPSDFPTDEIIERRLDVGAGSSELQVRLNGSPGSLLDVEIRFDSGTAAFTTPGINDLVDIGALGTDHPLLLPLEATGFHNDTLFVAGVFPRHLAGDHAIDFEFVIRSLETCEDVARIGGTQAINSPTYFSAIWDGRIDTIGSVAPEGRYAYFVEADIVRLADNVVVDQAVSEARGLLIDYSALIFDRQISQPCNPEFEDCGCGDLPESLCKIITYDNLIDPRNTTTDLSEVITTTFDEDGRATVHVDLRNFNGGGLVPLKSTPWSSVDEAKEFISSLTGVPASSEELFPFHYVQNGWSTILNPFGPSPYSSGHFLLDLLSDGQGRLFTSIGTYPIRQIVEEQLQDNYEDAPEGWDRSIREGMGCSFTGNFDGDTELRARQCSLATAFELADGVGLYQLETRVFDIERNNQKINRVHHCTFFPTLQCTYRSIFNPEPVSTEHRIYRETEDGMVLDRTVRHDFDAADRVLISFPRGRPDDSIDGICSRTIVGEGELITRLDTADGAVSETCITNGVYL